MTWAVSGACREPLLFGLKASSAWRMEYSFWRLRRRLKNIPMPTIRAIKPMIDKVMAAASAPLLRIGLSWSSFLCRPMPDLSPSSSDCAGTKEDPVVEDRRLLDGEDETV